MPIVGLSPSFQFGDTSLHRVNQGISLMFPFRNATKVNQPIVRLNTIKVVDKMSLRNIAVVTHPNLDMLTDIAIAGSSRMGRVINHYITCGVKIPTAFPRMGTRALVVRQITLRTSLRWARLYSSAIRAGHSLLMGSPLALPTKSRGIPPPSLPSHGFPTAWALCFHAPELFTFWAKALVLWTRYIFFPAVTTRLQSTPSCHLTPPCRVCYDAL